MAALFAACALYFYAPVASIFTSLSPGYNEGWNALHTARLVNGQQLYPPISELIQNNYPPVSFYVVAAVSRLTDGDALIAGRLVAIVSLLIIAGAIGVASAHAMKSRGMGVVAALSILAIIGGQYQVYVAYDDPQLLAHAFMACGVATLFCAPLRRRSVILASLLMLLGGFTKHMLLPAPLAVTVWLFIVDKRLFRVWIAASISFACVAFIACYALYGVEFFSSVLGYKRSLSLGRFLIGAGGLSPLLPIILVGAVPIAGKKLTASPAQFFSIAMIFGVAISLLARSGAGVDVNAYFDIVIYGVPAALAGVQQIVASTRDTRAAIASGVLLGLLAISPAFTPAPIRLPGLFEWRKAHADLAKASKEVIEGLRAIEGPVACEQLSYCYWAGKSFDFDIFNVDQASRANSEVRDLVEAKMADGAFAAIQLEPDWRAAPFLVNDAIAASYAPIRDYPNGVVIVAPK
ncbi:MAG: hypothetical protein H6848_08720 [Caulobacterales bacterium]|nr:hypothetical protein [Caulobacterales bacterium]